MNSAPATINAFLNDLAMETKRVRSPDHSVANRDFHNQDDTNSIDELFTELECEFAGVRL
jgi:hypothetical protein